MKRAACQLSLVLASLAAAPAAWCGPDIMKCVDKAGHITLTDQPCAPGTTAERVLVQEGYSGTAGSTGAGGDEQAAPAAPAVEHFRAPAQPRWRPKTGPAKAPMTRDAATLKAARAQLLLQDGKARQGALATLN
jgi:hypothetical protein